MRRKNLQLLSLKATIQFTSPFVNQPILSFRKAPKNSEFHTVFMIKISGIRFEDHLSDGGKESAGAEAGRGEETRRGDQLLEENKSTTKVSARGNHISEEINFQGINACTNI